MSPTSRRRRGSRRPQPTPLAARFATALAAAREEAEISQRELAERTGTSNSTIASLERGADVQWNTLAVLLEAIPGLAGRDILPNPSGHPPAAQPGAWLAHRDLFGFECERAVVTLRLDARAPATTRVELERVQLTSRRAADPVDLTALMRMVSRAPFRVSLAFDGNELLETGRCERPDGDARHRFELLDRATRAFSYRAEGLPAGAVQLEEDASPQAAATLGIAHPVRRLKLVVESASSATPHAIAWLPAGMSEPWASDLLRFLHPGQRMRRLGSGRAQRAELSVEWPPIGTAYALGLVARPARVARPGARLRPQPPVSFAEVSRRLAEARERSGLSIRMLASELRVAPSTILRIEEGIGGRASLLASYLERFPDLAPQDLLPAPGESEAASLGGLWEFYVRLFGFVTDEIHKISRIRADGTAQIEMITTGLRARGRGDEPVRLRTQIQRALSEGEMLPPAITAGGRLLRRRLVHQDGEAAWQFVFPRELTDAGADYRRVYPWRPWHAMTAKEARRRFGGDPPYVAATSYPTLHATRRLTLEVRFPHDFRPASLGFSAWHHALPPMPDDAGQRHDILSRFDHDTRVDRRRRNVAILRVARPVPGVRFVIWWILPD